MGEERVVDNGALMAINSTRVERIVEAVCGGGRVSAGAAARRRRTTHRTHGRRVGVIGDEERRRQIGGHGAGQVR